MNATRPIRPPPSHFDGRSRLTGALLVVALLAVIIKPWGSQPALAPVPTVAPPPTASPSARPAPVAATVLGFNGRAYNSSIFGNHEPPAEWAVWPAGYLVTYGFVVQIVGSSTPSPSPQPSRPAWPTLFSVPDGNHLLVVGIDTPLGYQAAAQLFRLSDSGGLDPIGIERLPSPWPGHFTVIGISRLTAGGPLVTWPGGRYRLDLTFQPGTIARSLEIRIPTAVVLP